LNPPHKKIPGYATGYVYRYTAIIATHLNTVSEKFSETVETAL
jgi:hypothetical protein